MSSSEEIRDVYETDIAEKNKIVLSQPRGILYFLESEGIEIKNLFEGTSLTGDARTLLQRIRDNDKDWSDAE